MLKLAVDVARETLNSTDSSSRRAAEANGHDPCP
jgi:hypothetical protein